MTHPILAAAATIDGALKAVAGTNPGFMATGEKAAALRELVVLESRVAELRLRVLADAGDVAEGTAAQDAAGWLAGQTRSRFDQVRADLRLATAVDRRWTVVGAGLREGRVNLAQARVIVQALDALPDRVPADLLAKAEAALVGYAEEFGPKDLARLGSRILDVVAPEVADEAEARRLAALERAGRAKTRLMLRRLGDGTTRISGRLPDAAATRLATMLAGYTNPRKSHGTDPGNPANPDGTIGSMASGSDPLARLPYPRRLGEAFCQLLEALDPARLPVHGGDATTVVVTIDLDTLRTELGTGQVIGAGHLPGEDATGDRLTAAEVRRLACTAKIIPAVLGGTSELLDLGRAQRLFTAAQRRALLIRDQTCRAEHCDIPGTWAEAHHWLPWTAGGPTDLDNGTLLCSHHHHRAHDPDYQADRLPNGDVRFVRRR